MSESTCLHIQDRESGPIRVVELPWISVRIGRAAFCEVRLTDPEMAPEACRLTRRGRTWSLTPVGSPSPVVLDGRPVKSPCPLPFGAPIRIGAYCLTLRQDAVADPDWEMYPASMPPAISAPVDAPAPEPEVRPELEHHGRPAEATTPGPDAGGPASRSGRDRSRWEARWKAAEAHLKSRPEGFPVGVEARRSPQPPAFDAMPTRERPASVARPPVASTPLVDPVARPIPTSRAPRIEPSWSTPRSDPPAVAPRVDPPVRPVPTSAAGRFEPAWTGPPGQPPAPSVAPAPSWSEWIARERPSDTVLSPAARRESAEPSDPVREGPAPDHTEASPAPMSAGTTNESVATAAVDRVHEWPESPGPDSTSSRGADEGPRLVPPEVGAARDPSTVVEPLPIAEPAGRQVDDQPVAAMQPEQTGTLRDDRARVGTPPAPAWGEFQDAPRPLVRETKKRKVVRDRLGPERRTKAPRASRIGDRSAGFDASRDATTPEDDDAIWPSVKDILPNHGASLGPQPTVWRAAKSRQPMPTVPREPGQWMLPVWLAWPPLAIGVLVLGMVSSVLSWTWAVDSSSAAVVTHRLMSPQGPSQRKPLPDWVVPPDGRWLTTTSQHMAHWAVYLGGAGGGEEGPATDVPAMLGRALQISPLNPTARLARARREPTAGARDPNPVDSLGLSRDAVSLAWSARRLLDAGKKAAALRLYGQALSAASGGGFSRTVTPRYDDDESSRRYLLPGEDAVRDIVAEMAARDWTFSEWSPALPRNPTVLLATARLLREKNRPGEAEPLLALIVEGEAPSSSSDATDPRAAAARAEALALGSHLKEAEQEYRRAIELADNDMVRRSWWFNLADIALRLDDETQRQVALRAAFAVPNSDEITRRASSIQRASSVQRESDSQLRGRLGPARAN